MAAMVTELKVGLMALTVNSPAAVDRLLTLNCCRPVCLDAGLQWVGSWRTRSESVCQVADIGHGDLSR